ncbi:MAG: excinuclease ABC subunit UvrC [Flavobacteriaceae bacterium]|nr:excinuclease ABC subunit UvrC [Flavobacteriaceae bacterium]
MAEASMTLQIATLPDAPGVYQFYDKQEKLLYIGKAKNLQKRVRSYFNKQHENARTRIMVKKIHKIRHIVVDTETDALLLENNLIKKYQPRYNVLLKDDKSYPWICVKNEPFPRVFMTRRLIKDGSHYYGPYTQMRTVQTLLELIRGLYPLRTCNYDLADDKITSGKYKVCLEYHIGNCLGACEGHQNFKASLVQFKAKMNQHAANLEFEAAAAIKEKIDILENYQARSTVVSPKIVDTEVYSIRSDEDFAYVNFLQVAFGSIVRSHTIELKKKLDESDKSLLELAFVELRQRFNLQAKNVIAAHKINTPEGVEVTVPKQGDKMKLLELSLRNAKYFRLDRLKQAKIVDPDRHEKRIMAQMKKDLRLPVLPEHIECFDNSNLQGTNPVAACVVFKRGKPAKKEYRKFNIKTVTGPDDFASMEEVVYRRYKRLLEEDQPLPNLIIIDGGKGQLSSALKSLELLGLRGKISIIGIAKRLEELFYPDDPIPLYLDKTSETLKVIQQLRNEAHRFGITFHRQKRSKEAIDSALDTIPGVGEKTVETLLRTFKSPARLKKASFDEISALVGAHRAQKIIDYFQNIE